MENSGVLVWDSLEVWATCKICGKREAFSIDPAQPSVVLKNLVFKMIEKMEYDHHGGRYHD